MSLGENRGRLCVIVASRGRAPILGCLTRALDQQTRRPDLCVLSVTDPADLPALHEIMMRVEIVIGAAGTSPQRNRGIDFAQGQSSDFVVFLDDDFVPERRYLEMVEAAFIADPAIVAVGGHVIADGAQGPGYSWDSAESMIATYRADPDRLTGTEIRTDNDLYGCNMSFDFRKIHNLRFDERLVLYGWLEDRDFAQRAARIGSIARSYDAVGVHLGIKLSRTSGRRFGYSQVINPAYLFRKGTISLYNCVFLMLRGLASNTLRSISPEPYIDRRGRLLGNVLALKDLLRGRIVPEKVLDA